MRHLIFFYGYILKLRVMRLESKTEKAKDLYVKNNLAFKKIILEQRYDAVITLAATYNIRMPNNNEG